MIIIDISLYGEKIRTAGYGETPKSLLKEN